MKNRNGTLPELSIVDRCREWIHHNVPRHTQAEYEALLLINQDLMVRLISKCIDFDELLKAHRELQDEVGRNVPTIPVRVTAYNDFLPYERAQVYTLRWDVDPMKACVRLAEVNTLQNYMNSQHTLAAMKSFFDRNIVPALWEQSERNLLRAIHTHR